MNSNNGDQQLGADGLKNPFARGGIQRSPLRKAEMDAVKDACEDGKGSTPSGSTQDIAVAGPLLIKAVGRQRDTLPKVVALSEQLDALIEFAKSRTNTTKYLKQALYMLRSSVDAAKKEHAELKARAVAAEKNATEVTGRATKSVQTDTCTFAAVCASGSAAKRARQSPGEAPENSKKRLVVLSPQDSTPTASKSAEKSAEVAATGNPWVTVGGRKRQKDSKRNDEKATNRPKMGKKARSRGDALILKTEGSKYSEVLKKMRGETQLKDLGADVRTIRRSRTGEMILELRKDAKNKGAAYKTVAEQVLGKDVQIRALTSEVTLQLKNLDEITERCDIAQALKEKCGVEVATEVIRLRKGPAGTQVATFRLASADATLALKTAKLKVGWSVCPLSILQQPDVCFRCFEGGHKSWTCKGPDRSQLCRRCGGAGHKAKDCGEPPRCLVCTGKRDAKHFMGGPRCPAGKAATKPRA